MQDVCIKFQNFSFSGNYKVIIVRFGLKMFHFSSFLPLSLPWKHNLHLFTVSVEYKKKILHFSICKRLVCKHFFSFLPILNSQGSKVGDPFLHLSIHPYADTKNPQEKKTKQKLNKSRGSFVSTPGFELYLGVYAEQQKNFQKIHWDLWTQEISAHGLSNGFICLQIFKTYGEKSELKFLVV